MNFLDPEMLEAARLPTTPGRYWAKKSPMADWKPVQVNFEGTESA